MSISNPPDPEPCDTCETGISRYVCYDDIRRCRTCVFKFAKEKGWMDDWDQFLTPLPTGAAPVEEDHDEAVDDVESTDPVVEVEFDLFGEVPKPPEKRAYRKRPK